MGAKGEIRAKTQRTFHSFQVVRKPQGSADSALRYRSCEERGSLPLFTQGGFD
jgi:hypothetical protein